MAIAPSWDNHSSGQSQHPAPTEQGSTAQGGQATQAAAWQVYADGDKRQIGQSLLVTPITEPMLLDAGAIARPGMQLYHLQGPSACSLTPGP